MTEVRKSESLLGYAQIPCSNNGRVHAIIEVHDMDASGFSKMASDAHWMQILTPEGRAYCCPLCHAESWKDWNGQDMGR